MGDFRMANGDFEAREDFPGLCFFIRLQPETHVTDAVN